jgi:hypothetical protein
MYCNCLAARNVYLFIYYLFICLSIPKLFLHVHHTLIKSKAPPLEYGTGIIVYTTGTDCMSLRRKCGKNIDRNPRNMNVRAFSNRT